MRGKWESCRENKIAIGYSYIDFSLCLKINLNGFFRQTKKGLLYG